MPGADLNRVPRILRSPQFTSKTNNVTLINTSASANLSQRFSTLETWVGRLWQKIIFELICCVCLLVPFVVPSVNWAPSQLKSDPWVMTPFANLARFFLIWRFSDFVTPFTNSEGRSLPDVDFYAAQQISWSTNRESFKRMEHCNLSKSSHFGSVLE